MKHNPGRDRTRTEPPTGQPRPGLACLLVVVVTAAVFANALTNGFVWVDHKEIVRQGFVIDSREELEAAWTGAITDLGRNSAARDDGPAGPVEQPAPSSGYYRPVQLLFVTLTVKLFGQNAALHHLANIVLHLISTLLLMGIVYKLTGHGLVAFLCGLFFGVHPIHVECVTWVAGSKDVLSGLFFFSALFLYVKSTGIDKSPAGAVRRSLLYTTALFFFVLGLLAKEAVIVLPGILVLVEIFCGGRAGRGYWARVSSVAWFGAAALAYLVLRRSMLGGLGDMGGWHGGGPVHTFLTMPGVLAGYVWKLFVPLGLTTADTTRIVTNASDPVFLRGAALITAMAAALFLCRKALPAAALGLAWFGAALLPALNILPVHHIQAERFLYLPSAGFLIALSAVWVRVGEKKRAAFYGIAVYLLFLGWMTVDRNNDWKDDITLFSRDLAETPHYREGHAMLGIALFEEGRAAEALAHFEAAAREEGRYASFINRLGLHHNRGRALLGLGRAAEAIEEFQKAAAIDTSEPLIPMNMGIAYGALGRVEEALESYGRAEGLDSGNPLLFFNRGMTLYTSGRPDEALLDLKQAARLAPDHIGTLNLSGMILMEKRDTAKAAGYFRRSLALKPGQARISAFLRDLEGREEKP